MVLGRQINSLLKRHSAVFVKGLGTFRRIRTSASYDTKRKMVLPPLSYVEFEHEAQDGYDFTLYVQQSHQVEKTEAELIVQREIDKLIDSIHTNGQVILDEIGSLVTYGHSFIFKPLDLSGFQFVPIEDPYQKGEEQEADNLVAPVSNDNPQIESAESNAVTETSADVEQTTLAAAPVQPFPQQEDTQEYYQEETPKRNNALVYALIAVVALVALGGIYYYSIISKKLENVDEFLSAIDSTDVAADTLSYTVDSNAMVPLDSTGSPAKDSLAGTSREITAPVVEEPALHKYAIVIGTHPKLEQAKAEAADYHKKGFQHVRALPSNLGKNRKKVIWDSYPTKELRDSALRYVQKNVKADAWPTVL